VQKKILVVDDELDQVELISFNLRKAGFSVATAMNGIEALDKARSILPDLILLDLRLPELDGFAVCETLRRGMATASIPILMLTAVSGELGRLNAVVSGADDYITKPFSPKDLVDRVNTWISKPSRFTLATSGTQE
jgi:DNA-binding response OmpR family regulator